MIKMGVCAKLATHNNFNYTPLTNSELDIMFALMQEAGVRWVRYDWLIHKFTSDGVTFNFSIYDNIVDRALSHGIKTVALINQFDYYTPAYAQRPGYTGGNKLITTEAYEELCTQLATHFDGRVDLWELGNEPGGSTFWGNQPPNAANFVNWYQKPGYEAIKAVNPDNVVLTAGLTGGWGGGDGVGGIDLYLNKMYIAGAHGYFDGLAIHPYSRPNPPDFSSLTDCKVVMANYGDGNLPVYVTEVGWPTVGQYSVSEEVQAEFITQMYEMVVSGDFQYVKLICYYDFKNDGVSDVYNEDNYGIVRNEAHPLPYSRKPAYAALKAFATSLVAPFPVFRKSN